MRKLIRFLISHQDGCVTLVFYLMLTAYDRTVLACVSISHSRLVEGKG